MIPGGGVGCVRGVMVFGPPRFVLSYGVGWLFFLCQMASCQVSQLRPSSSPLDESNCLACVSSLLDKFSGSILAQRKVHLVWRLWLVRWWRGNFWRGRKS